MAGISVGGLDARILQGLVAELLRRHRLTGARPTAGPNLDPGGLGSLKSLRRRRCYDESQRRMSHAPKLSLNGGGRLAGVPERTEKPSLALCHGNRVGPAKRSSVLEDNGKRVLSVAASSAAAHRDMSRATITFPVDCRLLT